jgi:alpha-glucuronidase
MKRLLLTLFSFCILQGALAEDGSRLWLRQATDAQATVTCKLTSETAQIAQAELEQAWKGVPVVLKKTKDKDLRKLPASSYRIRAIEEGNILTAEEQNGAKKTLQAAAMTYVAATATALAQLLRLIVIFGGGRRRRD